MGGSRIWSFDWVINATVDELYNLWLEYLLFPQQYGWGSVSQYVKLMGGHLYIKSEDEVGD